MNRHQQDTIEHLQEEVRVLREMLGQKLRFNDHQRRRLAVKGKRPGHQTRHRFVSLVTPNTPLAWHQRLVAQQYDSSQIRKPGRPKTKAEIEELIFQLARENRSWGYTRIQGALASLRHEISPGSHRQCAEGRRLGPGPNAATGNDLEGVYQNALGSIGGHGFLHGGTVDVTWIGAVSRVFCR